MKPASFAYHRAASIDEALALLAELGEGARFVAGGQSIGPMLNLRLARPTHVVDISRIDPLRELRVTPQRTLWIGAGVTHARMESVAFDGVAGALLRRVAGSIAYRAIRTRGTVGGSLAHADPAADWPTALSALDAKAHIASRSGPRTLPVRQFIHGYFETALQAGEMLVGIEVPSLPEDARCVFRKVVRKTGEFAQAMTACVLHLRDGAITRPQLWLGAAAAAPWHATAAGAAIEGKRWDDSTRAVLYAAVTEQLAAEAATDAGDAQRYRVHLHALTACDAVAEAVAREEG